MKFTKLVIKNFLAITDAAIDLSDRGLVLIQGENLDDTSASSNGAGKSSIADALSWALYGITARGVSGDDVVNETIGGQTEVSVCIEDGAQAYVIQRYRKHSAGKNSLKITDVIAGTALTKGTDKLTQEVVNRIVGSSHEVFNAAVYAGQEKMPDLPAATDKALKILIEEASGVTMLEAAYQEARERAANVKMMKAKVDAEIGIQENKLTWATNDFVTAATSISEWFAQNEIDKNLAKDAVIAQVAIVRTADEELSKLDASGVIAAIADCDAKIAAVSAENKTLGDLTGTLTVSNLDLSNVVMRHARTLENIKALNEKILGAHKIVGCPCGECARPLTAAEVAPITDTANANLAAEKINLASLETESANLKKSTQKLTDERAVFIASMTDLTATNALRALKSNENAIIERKKADRNKLATSAKLLGEKFRGLCEATNPHVARKSGLEAQIATIETSLTAVRANAVQVQTDFEHAEAVIKVFSPAGVRARILDDVTPFLNRQTSEYLSTLSDGNISATWTTLVKNAKGELREKFSIEVENDKGAKSFAGLSGGEKRKVRIATALALQDLVATRATKPIELFIADEIDDALDSPGLERLMTIMNEKALERGSVFIISHRDLKDWIPQILNVRKKGGVTTIDDLGA
ncbi:MAG: AAA family ATPase [Undibacterium sp.]